MNHINNINMVYTCTMSKTKAYRLVTDVSESLAVRAPHLVDEIVQLPLGAAPETIYPSANVYATWKCSTCAYIWEAKINNRFAGRGCPVCANKIIVPGLNDFASSEYKSLLSEWDYDSNTVRPTELSPRSGKKVWWVGSCGHKWYTSIHNRTTSGRVKGCPACSVPAKLIVPGFNDFASVAPHLVKYWHQENSTQPDAILAGSRKIVMWDCGSGHSWNAPVYDMLVGVTGCVQCSDIKNPKIEVAIFSIIKEVYPMAELHYTLPIKWGNGHRYEVDIWVPETNTCVEWDGARWHAKRIEKDTEKTTNILSSGRKVVRIRNLPLTFLDIPDCEDSLLQIPAVWTLDRAKLETMLIPVFDFLRKMVT